MTTIKRKIIEDIMWRPIWQLNLYDFIAIALEDERFDDPDTGDQACSADMLIASLPEDVMLDIATKYFDLFRRIFNIEDWSVYVRLFVEETDIVKTLKQALVEGGCERV